MYILYLDDAGSVNNASDTHVVLAGVALFERQIHFLDQSLNLLAAEIEPQEPHRLEFHANHILNGKRQWRRIDKAMRRRHLADGLRVIDKLRGNRALFGVVVEKAEVSPRDALEYAFEQVCSRFDHFLDRRNRNLKKNEGHRKQRGLLVLDKSTRETRLQELTREFRRNGRTWGKLRNFVDVPFFVDSEATRAIQYADMVAYALWRKFEKNDPAFFEIIETAFDAHGGVRHGLHIKQNTRQRVETNNV
jgi:Protein of unknown function (DUF3800)